MICQYCFFFSSRRRHTRWPRDWSSDVCSSDLNTFALRSGVYAVQVQGLEPTPITGVASLGVRPTVEDEGRLLLEVHLFNRNIDAYGKLVCVDFLQFLRDEEKFPDVESLRAAIVDDVRSAQDYFTSHGL